MIRTAECVTPNHPDKICDRISDAILDACLEQDSNTRAAIETMGGHGIITITGELTTEAYVDIPSIVKGVYGKDIGVQTNIVKQSPEIAQGVDTGGAGDQGIMVGYACNENKDMIPQELYLARDLCKKIYESYPFDGKTQVTLDDGKIKTIVASFQNAPDYSLEQIIFDWLDNDIDGIEIHCNPAGDWTQGGFDADAGVTGRKLVVDNYGPRVPIGGGAFSGKDSSKVDRSAAYMARKIAVDYLKQNNAKEVFVYLAYAIGYNKPVQSTVIVDGKEFKIHFNSDEYDLTPSGIIKTLGLQEPKFEKTAEWGHMGTNQSWG
jgi:S-adenosylmethionine synthetase